MRRRRPRCLLAAALACAGPAGAAELPPSRAALPHADFAGQAASADARRVADWAVSSHDPAGLPFILVDKVAARVFAFDPRGVLAGTSPALLGLARGDDSPPGIGERTLAEIGPADRITPAGRFVASHGHDLGEQDIVWVDYAAAISLHRVVTSKPSEARLRRLATPTVLDNRISYGCINVPAAFYDLVIQPIFRTSDAIVYILPETRSIDAQFFPARTERTARASPIAP